jgi:hypothetical protein
MSRWGSREFRVEGGASSGSEAGQVPGRRRGKFRVEGGASSGSELGQVPGRSRGMIVRSPMDQMRNRGSLSCSDVWQDKG